MFPFISWWKIRGLKFKVKVNLWGAWTSQTPQTLTAHFVDAPDAQDTDQLRLIAQILGKTNNSTTNLRQMGVPSLSAAKTADSPWIIAPHQCSKQSDAVWKKNFF